MEGMQDWVWCFVDLLSSIIFFLDVSVDVAPLLAVATSIQKRHAKAWVPRVVRKLLCETPLACTLRRISAEIVRGELEERGIATDASPYYEWCALEMHLVDAMIAWIDREVNEAIAKRSSKDDLNAAIAQLKSMAKSS